jgi:hypothetical protein
MDDNFRLPLEWNLPLSGAVTQSFALPFSAGGQFGLFNINLGSSGDTALEQQMLTKVGSYGRQLGRLCDAVEVLLKKAENKNLTPDDERALETFHQMTESIRHTKTSHAPQPQSIP